MPIENSGFQPYREFMTALYPSEIETRRPVRKQRTRNRLWLPDMTELVKTLHRRIAALASDASGSDDHISSYLQKLKRELSRDMDQDIGADEIITLLVQNILSAPLVASFYPDRHRAHSQSRTLDVLTDRLHHDLQPELACLKDFYAMADENY